MPVLYDAGGSGEAGGGGVQMGGGGECRGGSAVADGREEEASWDVRNSVARHCLWQPEAIALQ
jgi:hypothetical protein